MKDSLDSPNCFGFVCISENNIGLHDVVQGEEVYKFCCNKDLRFLEIGNKYVLGFAPIGVIIRYLCFFKNFRL